MALYAHRVNTINGAYRNYYERKVKSLEIDIQITRDNKIIVFHDDVSKCTLKHLRNKYKDIVLLEEFLQHTPSDIVLNIELKRYDKNKDYVNRVIALCRKHKTRQFLYSSFDAQFCKQLAKLRQPVMHLHHTIDTVSATGVMRICVHKAVLPQLGDIGVYDSVFVYDVHIDDLNSMITTYPNVKGWIVDF